MKKRKVNNTLKCLLTIGIFALGICLIIASTENDDVPTVSPAPAIEPSPPPPTPWSFGVMGDTQWVFSDDPDDPIDPNSVSGSFITQINQEFINKGVKFVIAVGDLTDRGTTAGIASRAELAQELYDAGIGFFPFRGNHETYLNIYYPDADPNSFCIPAIQANFPQNQGTGPNLFGATSFSSPSSTEVGLESMATELNGIAYAFDYGDEAGNDATFVIFDPWETDSMSQVLFSMLYWGFWLVDYNYGYAIEDVQPWISSRLDVATRGTEHAFIFTHQPLIAGNHADSPFGFLDEHTDAQNTFYASLADNDVAFFIGGHDHMHHRDLLVSPDGLSEVEQVISMPACPKMYHVDYAAPEWRGAKDRQTPISGEYDGTGYYIYTIEGPIVTVDFYSDTTTITTYSSDAYPDGSGSMITPTLNFTPKETWRFSLNGKAFMVAQGRDYSIVTDSYDGTSVSLMGTNASTSTEDPTGPDPIAQTMPLTKRITTAWKDQPDGLISSVLMLAGLNETGAERTEPYVLSMSAPGIGPTARIVAQTSTGEWVNAASLTAGDPGSTSGPASTAHDVGTYGMDSATNSVWAVLDYDGIFGIKIN
jgi:hypothetical protein